MAQKAYVPVGRGGRLLVPTDPAKQDKIMDWQFDPTTKEPFTEPRKPDDTLHRRGGRIGRYCKGGKVISSRSW